MKVFPQNILREETSDKVGTIYLYGRIGQQPSLYMSEDKDEDITDVEFMKALKGFEKSGKKVVNVRINSPGGSMYYMDGMIAQVQNSPLEIHMWVDGVAASAAATFFLSVPKARRHMAKNAKLMLHKPSGGAYGSSKDLRSAADMLDAYEDGAVVQLAADTGMTEDDVRAKFFDGADHWLTAKGCQEIGFVANVEEYEAENVPAHPEAMTALDLENFFSTAPKAESVSLFKKLFHAAFPQNSAPEPAAVAEPITQNQEEMNLDNLKQSLESGDIQEADVVALLQGRGYDVTQQAPVATTELAAEPVDVQALVTAAIKPLTDQLAAMQAKLDKTPASVGPTLTQTVGDPPSGDPETPADPETQAAQAVFQKTLKRERHEA